MTPADITAARAKLGRMRGLERPLFRTELARELRMSHSKGDDAIRKWEQGKVPVPGPASLAIEALLAGFMADHIQPKEPGS